MLKTRILTALVLLPLMLAALFLFPPVAWAAFCTLVIGLGLWEYGRMAGLPPRQQAVYLVVSLALAVLFWRAGIRPAAPTHVAVLLFWLVLAPWWLVRRWQPRAGVFAWALGWVLMFPAWFAMLAWRPAAEPRHALALLALMGLVWVADVAAYFAGKAFGRHKLAPAISPGKSREGVYGAMVAVALYALLVGRLGWLGFPLANWQLVLLALPLTIVSVVGDLLESWLKRCAGVKDSSRLLPGHGGVYDRIDSLVAVLAVGNALAALIGATL